MTANPTKADPDACGCGAEITSTAAWDRHIRGGCTLAGLPGTSTHPNVAYANGGGDDAA